MGWVWVRLGCFGANYNVGIISCACPGDCSEGGFNFEFGFHFVVPFVAGMGAGLKSVSVKNRNNATMELIIFLTMKSLVKNLPVQLFDFQCIVQKRKAREWPGLKFQGHPCRGAWITEKGTKFCLVKTYQIVVPISTTRNNKWHD